MTNEYLKEYFSKEWIESRASDIWNYKYTGLELIEKIKPNERVLDVGCGTNPYKKLLPNVYGIDITDIGADQVIAIEDFKTEKKFDVAFCLGSINFGPEELILRQIQSTVDALKPSSRIYWRCNPGRQDHNNEGCKQIDFFPWDPDKLFYYAKDFGYEVVAIARDYTSDQRVRWYAEWIK